LYANLYNLRFFNPISGTNSYSPQFGDLATLVRNPSLQQLRLTEADGTVSLFHDLTVGGRPGGFLSMTSPGGTTLAVTQETGNRIVEVQRTVTTDGVTVTESFLYDYITAGELSGHILSCTLRRQTGTDPWQNVVRVVYSYYGSGDASGSTGDLRTATRQVWQTSEASSSSSSLSSSSGSAGGNWGDVGTDYYRYYKDNAPHGGVHNMKFACGPESFAKLAAQAGDPFTAGDAEVSLFADYYYEYDWNDRVSLERILGGSKTFTFSYTRNPRYPVPTPGASSSSAGVVDFNTWIFRTTETKPDGSQQTVYANYAGQTMLSVVRAPASGSSSSSSSGGAVQQWCKFFKYDGHGRSILKAHPSAVIGYDDSYDDLLHYLPGSDKYEFLRDNDGLIELTEYFAAASSGSSSSSGGAVEPEGYTKAEKISQGQLGTPILLRSWEYASHTEGDTTIYPVAKDISYPDAADPLRTIITSYSYTYHSGTTQVAQQTTTLPVIPTTQNGSGTANSRKEYFDLLGYRTWSMDERGFITRYIYDDQTGAMIQRIDDVDTTIVSGAPSGWSTPAGGGLNLVTDYEHDDQGRIVQELGPSHEIDLGGVATTIRRATWTVYDDETHITRAAQGYATGTGPSYTYTLINPVQIQMQDRSGKLLASIRATRSSTSGKLLPTDAFPQSSYVAWKSYEYTDCCLTAFERVYHTIPASGSGSPGVNYDETTFGYDALKRRNRVVTPGGTITFTVFDVRGLPIAVYIGTNDAGATDTDPTGGGVDPANNMVLVTGNEYDQNLAGGDGNLTQVRQWVDSTSSRVTQFLYDWRNRRTATDGEMDFYEQSTYDNFGRVTKVERYDTSPAGHLVSRAETFYDDLSRVYRTVRYGVDPTTGGVGHSLTDNSWYDPSGNVLMALPAGSSLFTKTQYDSLGRAIKQFAGYTPGSPGTPVPGSVTADVILEQSETTFDAAGNAIQSTQRQRYHNAPDTQLGELQNPTSHPKARVSYVAHYPDGLGRGVATANYGTNGGTALSRSSTIPTRSDTVLVTSQAYDSAGRLASTTDPAGMPTCMEYDAADREITKIANCVSGSSSSSSSSGGETCAASDDVNITVRTTYNADGNVATLTAVNSATGDQVTQYVYGTTLADSAIAACTLKRAEIYPDSVEDDDRITFSYNRQGQSVGMRDQNGTVHAYDYDLLGRPTQDRVTTLGSGVDGAVRRIGTTYEVRGMKATITSYDNATVGSGNVLNECQFVYNDFGQLTTEYQSHSGTVNVSMTPKVQYTFADGSSNTIRPTGLVYPNGRALTYAYGGAGSISDRSSRIASIIDDDDTHLCDYSYLGLQTFVEQDDTEPQMKWTLIDLAGSNDPDTGDIYSGFDRFGRVKDNRWYNYNSATDVDRIQYGYDRASNRIWRKNTVAAALGKEFDEIYSYDRVHRLKDMARGTLNGSHTALTSETFAQCWTLDPTGNWTGFREDSTGSGTWDLDQQRSANKVNEISAITVTTGDQWATPAYDKNGNMTTIPRPPQDRLNWANLTTDQWSDLKAGDWTSLPVVPAFSAIYDAWNRILRFADGAETVSDYSYDGAKRLIVQNSYSGGSTSETRHLYYSELSSWQVIEERLASPQDDAAVKRQFILGLRYIDDLLLLERDANLDSILDLRTYTCQDGNWNLTTATNDAGSIVDRFAYSVFGDCSFLAPTFSQRATSETGCEFLYCGYRLDILTRSYRVRHRTYAPWISVWLERDLQENEHGTNLYLYCNSAPLGLTDPFGLTPDITPQIYDFMSEWAANAGTKCGANAFLKNILRQQHAANNCCEGEYITKTASAQGFGFDIGVFQRKQDAATNQLKAAGYKNIKWSGNFHVRYNITCCVGKPATGEVVTRMHVIQTLSATDPNGKAISITKRIWSSGPIAYTDPQFTAPNCCTKGCNVAPLP